MGATDGSRLMVPKGTKSVGLHGEGSLAKPRASRNATGGRLGQLEQGPSLNVNDRL